jgi:hypothetical protein
MQDWCPKCENNQELIFLRRGFGVEVKRFACGHQAVSCYDERIREDLVDTSFPISMGNDKIVLVNPVADVAKALKIEGNLFEAIVFSAVHLEFFCSKLLIERGVKTSTEVRDMTFYEISKELKDSGLIDEKTFSDISEVRETRNKIVHDPREWANLSEKVALEIVDLTFKSLKKLEPYYESCMPELRRVWNV